MNSIMLYKLLKDVNCNDVAKKNCYDLIYRLLCYSAKTRDEGLLSVEDLIDEIKEDLIKDVFIALLNTGNESHESFDYIDHIMLTHICASNFYNVELLKQLIIITGIKEIYSGANPGMVLERLSGLLGENHWGSLISYIEKQINNNFQNNKIIASLKGSLRWNTAFQEFKYKIPIKMSRDSINVIVNQEIGILNTEKSNITLTINTSDAFKSKINLIHQLHFGSGIIFKDDTKVASKINGNLVLGNDTLDVLPVFIAMSDVSSETGNIVFLGTVIVQGDVQPGYKVKAAGNVFVYGTADPNSVEAGGDVFIYDAYNERF